MDDADQAEKIRQILQPERNLKVQTAMTEISEKQECHEGEWLKQKKRAAEKPDCCFLE